MEIAIDGNEANTKEKVGVHQMAFELLWGFYKLQDTLPRGISYSVYLKSEPRVDLPPETEKWKYKILPGGRIWILTKLMPELWKGRGKRIFFTPTHYLPPLLPMPGVCSVTDLGYLKFTGQFRRYDYWQLRLWTAISLYISKYIITISDSTAIDIKKYYPFAGRKIKVIYLGSDLPKYLHKLSQKFVKSTLKHYRINREYILFLSTLKPSKNIEALIEAYYKSSAKGKYQLVLGGKKGWLYDSIYQKVKDLGIENDVLFTDYLPDHERVALLQNAKLFVLPSFWEGFGIDVLNAFVCGKPVVLSKVASLPEVGGKAAIYVDPNSTDSIRSGIEKVLNMSKKEYNKQVEMGYRQLEKFSWDKCSREVLNVLLSALET